MGRVGAFALALMLAAVAAASDREFVIPPGHLSMQSSPRGLKIKYRTIRGWGAQLDGESPELDGATLHIFNSAGGTDTLCLSLPSSNWIGTAFDRDTFPNGWTYKDSQGVLGPVARARFGNVSRMERVDKSDIRAVVRDATGFTLDESSQGSIGVTFRLANRLFPQDGGHTRYCTDFVPPYATITQDAPGVFRAQSRIGNYTGPCPVASVECP